MAASRTIHRHIAKGDFAALEDDWLEHVAADPDDVDYFAGVARLLTGNGEDERARTLLELADEQLRDRKLHATRLAFLKATGGLLFDPERLHAEIVATLRAAYAGNAGFAGLAEKVGLHRAPHDLPKTWEKVARLTDLLRFEAGAVVAMEGHGVGRVVELNFALDSFKIDFERHPGLLVGFRAAPKVLELLPAGHLLRRKLEEPAALTALVRADPSELLRQVLTSYDRPLTAGEVRERLAGVVGEGDWTSFWAAARKHPHVVASQGGRQSYAWAATSDHAVEATWKAFAAAEPRAQIALLRRDGDRDAELGRRMAAALSEAGAAAAGADPGLAFEIWSALERRGDADPGLAFAPERLIGGDATPARVGRLLSGIGDRTLRERAYELLRELRIDWPEIFLDRLAAEEDPRSLDLLTTAVATEAPAVYERFVDGLLTQPHRAPAAFAWLAERAADDPALRERNPLRLLQQILAAQTRDELAPYRARLRRLARSGGTLPRLLSHLGEDQAEAAREAIQRVAGLETWERDALLTALELRFPALRAQSAVETLYATPEAIAAKREELDRLTKVELPANRKAIEEARALGDLSENFEYKSARQRHEYLSSRATMLQRDLGRVRPLDLAQVDPSEVRIGTRVRLRTAGGEERELTILGPWESDPERGVVSYQSELAASLLGKRPGDDADLSGEAATVSAVEPVER